MINFSDKSFRGNQSQHFFCNFFVFCLWDNFEKYCREEQAKDDNMAQAHCMLKK
jgi:hypothetical protein